MYEPDFYLGWVIQQVGPGKFYIYSRADTTGSEGYWFEGTRREAYVFVANYLAGKEID